MESITLKRKWPLGFSNINPVKYVSVREKLDKLPPLPPAQCEPDKPVRIQIYGHSFVKNLWRAWDVPEKLDIIYSHIEDCMDAFNIELALYGKGGAKMAHLKKLDKEVRIAKLDGVVTEYGSNDLCSKAVDPRQLALGITEIIQNWINNGWIKAAIICEVTHRGEMNPFYAEKCEKDLDTYNRDVDLYNKYLVEALYNCPRIDKWRHYGMRDLTKEMSDDGVHHNTEEGFSKYCASLAGAVLDCRRKLLNIA